MLSLCMFSCNKLVIYNHFRPENDPILTFSRLNLFDAHAKCVDDTIIFYAHQFNGREKSLSEEEIHNELMSLAYRVNECLNKITDKDIK